jgi:hypothetical protein
VSRFCSIKVRERLRYFEGMLLGAEDFEREQEYALAKRRLHNRALHGAGVVFGLTVEPAGEDAVRVRPGLAIDSGGRELEVPEPAVVPLDPAVSTGELLVVAAYAEEERERTVAETCQLAVKPERALSGDDVVLAALRVAPGRSPVVRRAAVRAGLPATAALAERIDELERRLAVLERARGRPDGPIERLLRLVRRRRGS